MRIVDVACLRVRKSIREVLGVMDVHAEVVTPIMPFPERDEVEDADEDGAEKSDESGPRPSRSRVLHDLERGLDWWFALSSHMSARVIVTSAQTTGPRVP